MSVCTLLFFYRVFDGCPIVVASNRDERYRRRSSIPKILSHSPLVWGGMDLEAGGTWMGVNEFGLWAGIANQHDERPGDTALRSRGFLCMDVLKKSSCKGLNAYLQEIEGDRYKPFFLLTADEESGFFANYNFRAEVFPLKPGLYVLTNQGLDEKSDKRRQRIFTRWGHLCCTNQLPRFEDLMNLLKDHRETVQEAVCVHGA